MKNVLHNLSPSVVPDPKQATQYFSGSLLTFALNAVLDEKIIFFITEDQPLSFLLKTEYMLMDRHLIILAVLLFQINKLGYRQVT